VKQRVWLRSVECKQCGMRIMVGVASAAPLFKEAVENFEAAHPGHPLTYLGFVKSSAQPKS
jgi:hypothetical protein